MIAASTCYTVDIITIVTKEITKMANRRVFFDDLQEAEIFAAYDRGVGVNGIPKALGLICSALPIKNVLLGRYDKLRNRSEQQQARMDNSTPEQIAKLTMKANEASRGRKHTVEERIKMAKSMEGRVNRRSKGEPIVFDALVNAGFDPIASKAIHIYNADIVIRNIAIEVFGGGWSVSDKKRVAKYIKRTKKLAEIGYHTIFVILFDVRNFNIDHLVNAIGRLSGINPREKRYSMIWGDFIGTNGLADLIDTTDFISPTINVRDKSSGRFISVLKQ